MKPEYVRAASGVSLTTDSHLICTLLHFLMRQFSQKAREKLELFLGQNLAAHVLVILDLGGDSPLDLLLEAALGKSVAIIRLGLEEDVAVVGQVVDDTHREELLLVVGQVAFEELVDATDDLLDPGALAGTHSL